jgi:hypothetical protein
VIRSGVGGAKDRDQGECGPTKHVPDSEPDKRDTKGRLAYGSVVSSIPEVGAVCGKAARTDLCGGREATRVPTAKQTQVLQLIRQSSGRVLFGIGIGSGWHLRGSNDSLTRGHDWRNHPVPGCYSSFRRGETSWAGPGGRAIASSSRSR